MRARRSPRRRSTLGAATAIVVLAACSAATDNGAGPPGAERSPRPATATSVQDFGGMDKLISAAQEEGELNVVALPPDWANYGEIIQTFADTYDIEINAAQPGAVSQDEIEAATELAGTDRAPDVFDLTQSVALANTDLFAPYRVRTWDSVPENLKDPQGLWVADYGGYMSIGYDADAVGRVRTVQDLLRPRFTGTVALNGDPTEAGAAFSGVLMAAVATGGSADDIGPGVEFFGDLEAAGRFRAVDPTDRTIESGKTPVVIDWDYLNDARAQTIDGWRVVIPPEAVVGGYYYQAINADAPHPAAARLWQEFLYSDQGQNLWLEGGARPVRAEAMAETGSIDTELYDALPSVEGDPVIPTVEQTEQAAAYLLETWPEVGG